MRNNLSLVLLLMGMLMMCITGCKKTEPITNEPPIDEGFDQITLTIQEEAATSLMDLMDQYPSNEAIERCAEYLLKKPEVDSVIVDGWNIDIVFTDGTEGAILYRPHLDTVGRMAMIPLSRNDIKIAFPRNNILIWDPFDESLSLGATPFIVEQYENNGFNVEVISGIDCDIESLKNDIYGYDIVQFQTHGELGIWIVTKQEVTPEDDAAYILERRTRKIKRVTIPITGETFYAVSDRFIATLERNFDETVVFNWSCESLKSERLWKGFRSKGCVAYLGYDNSDELVHAMNTAYYMTPDLASGMTLGDAFDRYQHKEFTYTDEHGNVIVSTVLMKGNRDVVFFDNPSTPTVTTHEVQPSSIGTTTATVTGSVAFPEPNQSDIYERGFVYSTSSEGLVVGEADQVVYSGTDLLNFSCTLTDLSPNTIYYVRAYSRWENNEVIYGDVVSFTTEALPLPTIQTLPVGNITTTSAMFRGIITDGEFVQRGFCFGTLPNVTVGGAGCQQINVNGTDLGQYEFIYEGLSPNTTYYVRAFAKTASDDLAYGEELNFTTNTEPLPTVQTLPVGNVTATSVMFRGIITAGTFIQRGFCFSTSPNVIVDGAGCQQINVSGTDLGQYEFTYEGLSPNTTYYVRAFAKTEENDFAYGEELSFTTETVPLPAVQTLPVMNITATSAVFVGNIIHGAFFLRGFCFGTTPNVTVNGVGCQLIYVGGTDLGQYESTYMDLLPNTTYYVKAFAETEYAECAYGDEVSFTTNNSVGGHECVDLGLPSGTQWATCNVGANEPEEFGDYFAWGETQPKDYYYWSTYRYCMGSQGTLTKYCNDSWYGYNGFTDNLTTLMPEDDAATANWGSGWRMPTMDEVVELFRNTNHKSATYKGVRGMTFTGANGKSIFIPNASCYHGAELVGGTIASCPFYWTNSLYNNVTYQAWYLSDGFMGNYVGVDARSYGLTVRPVR